MDISFKDIIGPSFYRAWNDFYRGWYIDPVLGKTDLREQVFAGGRGSLKSSAVSIFIVLGLERAAKEAAAQRKMGNPKWKSYLTHAICFRKIAADLSTSVFAQFEWAINKLNLQDRYIMTKSPLRIIRRQTGQCIYFRGLDDPTKVKSIKPPGMSYFQFFWAEELDQFDGMEEIRNVRQSVLRGGHKFQSFYTYNPPETSANWVNYEMSLDVPGRIVYRSNYLSVPRDWLGENFFVEAEILKKTNYRAYAHEYLGEVTGNGGSVFPNVEKMHMSDELIAQFSNRRFGLDWGFAIDPACWIALHYDKTRRTIYIYDEIYGTEMTNYELSSRIKQKDMGYSYLMCDSAEPKSIAEFESFGINALPAQKGPDSVRFSTKWLQGLIHIYIDPERCPNAFREFTQYEYQKNKSGMFISKFPDLNNHAIDSCITGETLVQTASGQVRIRDLVGRRGKLLGYCEDGIVRAVEFRNCRKTREQAAVLEMKIEGGISVRCTSDHRILTPSGYVEAGALSEGSEVMTWGGARKVVSVRDGGIEDVYDLEVPVTHNFIVNGGLVVHNCRYALMEDAIDAGLF